MVKLQTYNGKSVVITGASSGLGEACARAFAKLGAKVILAARRKSRIEKLSREIRMQGGLALPIKCDVTDEKEVDALNIAILYEMGVPDVLINNAGNYIGGIVLWEHSIQDWDVIIDTNLRGPFLLCRLIAPAMVERGSGRIINVLSATSSLAHKSVFRASKVGLEILTLALAQEIVNTGVAVAGFNPGWMRTEISASGKSPRWAALVLTRLVQKPTSYLNGAIIDMAWRKRRPSFRRRLSPRRKRS